MARAENPNNNVARVDFKFADIEVDKNLERVRKILLEEQIRRRKEKLANMPAWVLEDPVKEIPNFQNQEEILVERNEHLVEEFRVKLRNALNEGQRGQILDTIGIEFESLGLTQKDVKQILGNLPAPINGTFRVHRDGSSEMHTYTAIFSGLRRPREIKINSHTNAAEVLFGNAGARETSGYELISIPMDKDVMDISVRHILPRLEASGDFLSNRCATHIHIGMGKSLFMLRNLLALGLWVDELLFSISGMGDSFRGRSNNAIYARPLINGPYFRSGGRFYQTLNWKKALDARNLSQFFSCYGIRLTGELPKYHPARYFSTNLYSVLLHETIEFRHFNQTFNAPLVIATASLCQMIAEIGIKGKFEVLRKLEPGNPFIAQPPSYYIDKLDKLMKLGEFFGCEYSPDRQQLKLLSEVISNYEGIGIEDIEVLTHIKDVNISEETIEDGQLQKSKSVPIPDGHIDIHNIDKASIIRG